MPDDEAAVYPLVTSAKPHGKAARHEQTFVRGLDIVPNGFEARLAAKTAANY